MSPQANPRYSVHGSRRRLKAWFISFNFDRSRALPSPVIFLAQSLPMGWGKTYNANRVLHTIWIAPECQQTTHLLFCRASKIWPQNDRKSCSYPRSKPWETLIYHPLSPRGIPRHLVQRSRGRLKTWLIAFNFDRLQAPPRPVIFFAQNLPMGCDTTYNAS